MKWIRSDDIIIDRKDASIHARKLFRSDIAQVMGISVN
jgi:hypothetical protein